MVKLEEKQIEAINAAMKKGERVELIPVKDGVKLMRVRREELNTVPPSKR